MLIPSLLLIAKIIAVLIVVLLIVHIVKIVLGELPFPSSVKQLILIAVGILAFVYLLRQFGIYNL